MLRRVTSVSAKKNTAALAPKERPPDRAPTTAPPGAGDRLNPSAKFPGFAPEIHTTYWLD